MMQAPAATTAGAATLTSLPAGSRQTASVTSRNGARFSDHDADLGDIVTAIGPVLADDAGAGDDVHSTHAAPDRPPHT